MNDIFNEIEQDLRQERMKRLWDRFGLYIIALAVFIVIGTAGWRYYDYAQTTERAKQGDQFLDALAFAEDGNPLEAEAALNEIIRTDGANYAILARFRLASLKANQGDIDAAISEFEALSNDDQLSSFLSDYALMRTSYLHLDHDVSAIDNERFEILAQSQSPFRYSAHEILGLKAIEQADWAKAREHFQHLMFNLQTPASLRARSQIAMAIIDGQIKAEPVTALPQNNFTQSSDNSATDDQQPANSDSAAENENDSRAQNEQSAAPEVQ